MELSILLFKKTMSMALIMMMGYAIRKTGAAKEEHIPIVSALLIWGLGVNPIYIILAAGIGGYVYGLFLKPSE